MLEKCDCDAPLRYVLTATGWLVRCTSCRHEWIERLLSAAHRKVPDEPT